MNHSAISSFYAVLVLLFVAAAPAAAESSTITSISPSVGYLGSTTPVTITGTDFNTSSVKVKLMMSGQTNITATVSSLSSTGIVCKFTLPSSRETGSWDVVVVNEDDSEAVKVDGFSLRDAISLSSLSPVTARTNDDTDFTLTGTGLSEVDSVYLSNEDYDNITASLDGIDSTEVTGTFDLTDTDEATYEICILDSAGTRYCGLSFEITTDQLGNIDISSSPTDVSVYLDSEYYGTTPYTIYNISEGSHKLILTKSGYSDWGKIVKVTTGSTTTVDADLEAITTVTTAPAATPMPMATLASSPRPTTAVSAVKTVKRSITTSVTPWPTDTTTPASPVGTLIIIGAVGLVLLLVRKE